MRARPQRCCHRDRGRWLRAGAGASRHARHLRRSRPRNLNLTALAQHLAPELADYRNRVEPGGCIGSVAIVLARLPRETWWDLAEVLRRVGCFVEVVILVAGNEEIFIRDDIDCANPIRRELGRRGLRRNDPNVLGACDKQVLHLSIARQDAKPLQRSAIQSAPGFARLDDAFCKVRLEAIYDLGSKTP